MSAVYTVMHAADLAANLPSDSRCMRALEPALEWSRQDYLLAEAVNMLRLLVWAQSRDGQKGRRRPQMIEPPQTEKHTQKQEDRHMPASEYRKQLGKERREVAN